MAVLFMDGFDTYDDASGPFDTGRWQSVANVLGPSVARSQGNGVYPNNNFTTRAWTPVSEVWCGAAVLFNGATNAYIFRTQNATSNIQFSMFRNVSGNITLNNSTNTVVATSVAVFPAGTWHYVEFRVFVGLGGIAEAWVDGVQVVTYGGDTRGTGATSVAKIELGSNAHYFDDFYALDTSGAAPNDTRWGDTRISPLEPKGPGNSTDWVPNGLVNHRNVAENDDGDDTVNVSSTVGATDLFEYQKPQIPAGTVLAMQEVTIARRGVSTVHSVAPVVRVAGTDYEGTTYALGTSYSTNVQIRETNPATGLPWTVGDLTTIESGYRLKV